MKLDTEESIRITVVIRKDAHPEWYQALLPIQSGRSRAELLRSHLAMPHSTWRNYGVNDRTVNAVTPAFPPQNQAVQAPQSPVSSDLQQTGPEPEWQTVNPVNSLVENGSTMRAAADFEGLKEEIKVSEIYHSAEITDENQPQKGGLASLLMNRGFVSM